MAEIRFCPECGVPEYIYTEHEWLKSGVIVQRRSQEHTVAFIENENIAPLFRSIEEIVGIPIEGIIIAARRRAARAYMKHMIPDGVRELLYKKEMGATPIIEAMISIGHVLGYGKFEVIDYRYERDKDDFLTMRIENPYFAPLCCCDTAATFEAITGAELAFDYHEVSPGVFETTAFVSDHPLEYKGRLRMRQYHHREGNIELERCATCGGPAALSGFKWDLNRGVINNISTGMRMIFFAPTVLDAIFGELEMELGETIPRVIVEAQRRFTKTGFYSFPEAGHEEGFRTQFALRGLGNLREITMGKKGLRLRLENACLDLMVVGLMQGFFELAVGVDSKVEWELSEEGDLEVEVTPRA